jgi:16S rRNA (guanine(1405)-N(7))-methyltransferase
VLQDDIEAVTDAVLGSRKYRHVLRDVVARLAEHALTVQRREPRAAVDSVKRALHQVYGAFGGGTFPLSRMRRELQHAIEVEGARRCEALVSLMRNHASTRERAPIVERFYADLFADGVPASVLDLGCGLNGLSLPLWPAGVVRYHGIDLDAELLAFVGEALSAFSLPHELEGHDLATAVRLPAADMVLMLKLYPTLEQQLAGSGVALIERLTAPRVVVSFPARSLVASGSEFQRFPKATLGIRRNASSWLP